jgi:hypothetical protein
MIAFLLLILTLNSEPANSQTTQISVNELFTYFNSDIDKVKAMMTAKGFKISYDGEKFGKVQFYQWYHGRTSHNADVFVQRYILPEAENYNWFDDCLEYIVYSADEFNSVKKQCEALKMKLLQSGQKEFTYEDAYVRDPGTFSIYQNDKYWLHLNAVQEQDKVIYKILLRKKPTV